MAWCAIYITRSAKISLYHTDWKCQPVVQLETASLNFLAWPVEYMEINFCYDMHMGCVYFLNYSLNCLLWFLFATWLCPCSLAPPCIHFVSILVQDGYERPTTLIRPLQLSSYFRYRCHCRVHVAFLLFPLNMHIRRKSKYSVYKLFRVIKLIHQTLL